jgi:predicted secreted hydrolase
MTRLVLALSLAVVTGAGSQSGDTTSRDREGARNGGSEYRKAMPGYQYQFPRDHFSHPDFQTEWWYYTGNLRTPEGHRYGFELTFFRRAISRAPHATTWDVDDAWLAHLALSDIDGRHFHHWERLNRSGPGIAGASQERGRIWNGNWKVQWNGSKQQLEAITGRFTLRLNLESHKPPVIHGQNGVSQKSAGAGNASHYISFTRLLATGQLDNTPVSGTAWMDHEFFTHQLDPDQTGWDWLSLQFDDNTELMVFRLRRKDGGIDPYSAGTYVDQQGKPVHLTVRDFVLTPEPRNYGPYAIAWRVQVPSRAIDLHVTTRLADQEITNYWEGAMDISGSQTGVGYLEMTGYRGPVPFL